eukprot:3316600-Amphidinium_carterae.2
MYQNILNGNIHQRDEEDMQLIRSRDEEYVSSMAAVTAQRHVDLSNLSHVRAMLEESQDAMRGQVQEARTDWRQPPTCSGDFRLDSQDRTSGSQVANRELSLSETREVANLTNLAQVQGDLDKLRNQALPRARGWVGTACRTGNFESCRFKCWLGKLKNNKNIEFDEPAAEEATEDSVRSCLSSAASSIRMNLSGIGSWTFANCNKYRKAGTRGDALQRLAKSAPASSRTSTKTLHTIGITQNKNHAQHGHEPTFSVAHLTVVRELVVTVTQWIVVGAETMCHVPGEKLKLLKYTWIPSASCIRRFLHGLDLTFKK